MLFHMENAHMDTDNVVPLFPGLAANLDPVTAALVRLEWAAAQLATAGREAGNHKAVNLASRVGIGIRECGG